MVRAILISDNIHIRNRLQEKLKKLLPEDSELRLFTGREAATRDRTADLIFMQTRLRHINVLDLQERLVKTNPAASFAFFSENLEDADFVLDTPVDGFLWLEDPKDRLEPIVKVMLERLATRQKDFMRVKRRTSFQSIPKDEILYLERDYRKLIFHLTNGSEISFYKPLEEVVEELDDRFMRVHNSYIINTRFIKQLTRDAIILENDVKVPISRTYTRQIRDKLIKEYDNRDQ